MIKGLTGRRCNRHRGRIGCDVELRGRTSWNVLAGSTETFTGLVRGAIMNSASK